VRFPPYSDIHSAIRDVRSTSDEDRTLARLRALHSDLIDPTIAIHHGRVVAVESSHTIDIDCFVPKSEIDERYSTARTILCRRTRSA